MKSNLEISLKFWTALIVFFASVLSFPLFSYLNENNLIDYNKLMALILGICVGLPIFLYVNLILKHSELKSKFNKEMFFKDVSMQTIEDYETQIKKQEDHIKELKKSFENAVVEITELRSKRSELSLQIMYWRERALHQKHTKKEVETQFYEYIGFKYNPYSPCYFENGKKYKLVKNASNDLFYLIDESGKEKLVEKKYFKPVTNGN